MNPGFSPLVLSEDETLYEHAEHISNIVHSGWHPERGRVSSSNHDNLSDNFIYGR